MDIYCPKRGCAEPVEMDYLHDVAEENDTTFTTVLHDFQRSGCEAIGMSHSTGNDPSGRAEVMDAMFDLLGDDVDGAAAMMEDFDLGF